MLDSDAPITDTPARQEPEDASTSEELLGTSNQEVSEAVVQEGRKRTPTEKGTEYAIAMCRDKVKSTRLALTKTTTEVLSLVSEAELHILKEGKMKLTDTFKEFSDAHQTYVTKLIEPDDIEEANSKFARANERYNEAVNSINETIHRVEAEESDSISMSSFHSRSSRGKRSTRSRRSNASSIKQLRSEAAAERAALDVDLRYSAAENELNSKLVLEEQKKEELEADNRRLQAKLDASQIKIKQQMEHLKLQRERDKAHVRERILADVDHGPNLAMETMNPLVVPTPKPILNPASRSLQVTPVPNEISGTQVPSVTGLNPQCAPFSPSTFVGFTQPLVASRPAALKESPGEINSPVEPIKKYHRSTPILPCEEPKVFRGDMLEYPVWKTRFTELIERNVMDPSRRLSYLNKYTAGEANQHINTFLVNPTTESYNEAQQILEDWYGDPDAITDRYRTKILEWPVISTTDGGKGLRQFSSFLTSCKTLMTNSKYLSINDEKVNQSIVSKLSAAQRDNWSRIIAEAKESANGHSLVTAKNVCNRNGLSLSSSATFLLLCDHVRKEAKVATQPVYGTAILNQIVAENRKIHPPYKKDYKSARTFATNSCDQVDDDDARRESAPKSGSESKKELNCLYCHGQHGLFKCSSFKDAEHSTKIEFLRENRLCFGCLKQNHIAKYCRHRLRCDVCNKVHPTALHLDSTDKEVTQKSNPESRPATRKEKTSSANCLMTGIDRVKSTRIVPVWIQDSLHPEEEIKTYCALDEHSDRTFISEKLMEKFDVPSHEVNLRITTLYNVTVASSRKVKGLRVRGLGGPYIDLPSCYSTDEIPVSTEQVVSKSMIKDCPMYQGITSECVEFDPDIEVGILIGTDCIEALRPIEVITDTESNSYAIRSVLGWSIVGLVTKSCLSTLHCNRIVTNNVNNPSFVPIHQTKELINPVTVLQCFEQDFSEISSKTGIMSASLSDKPISVEDKKFLRICEEGIEKTATGHYELPLPFRNEPKIRNNKPLAIKRLQAVKKRMFRDPQYKQDYCEFMEKIISKGHAEKVQKNDSGTPGQTWYLIHHGVYHPTKPNKIRVVYDGSAKYQGECLNDLLLPGPCLTNSIIGVMVRFRQGLYCFTADIEQMFYSVCLKPEYRDFFRFLWWEDGDTSRDPSEYRMTVHSFGVSSSPGCSIFALKKTAEDNANEFGPEVAKVIISSSYVDDILSSCDSVSESLFLTKSCKEVCRRGGFHLTKFAANNTEILSKIPVEDRCSEVKNIDLAHDSLPILRTLGVEWCIESDSFMFRVSVKERPFTRRGLLGTVCSIYDPCGYLAPLVLEGKLILQSMVKDKRDWDEALPVDLKPRWEKWISELPLISELKVRRCFKPEGFGNVRKAELHHFSDASNKAYGQCSYLRLIDYNNNIHCSFVIGKSRVAPLKFVTVPRLELTAAVVSVRVGKMLHGELEYENLTETYWTDSSVVLGYISNESKRFHTYIANRVEEIRSRTQTNDWFHVSTRDNVADDASRGLTAKELTNQCRYLNGPSFLWKPLPADSKRSNEFSALNEEDPKVKKATVFTTRGKVELPDLLGRMCYHSSWRKVLLFAAVMKRFIKYWKIKLDARKAKLPPNYDEMKAPVSVQEMDEAKCCVIKLVQKDAFHEELKNVEICADAGDRSTGKGVKVKKSSCMYKLHPFMDSDGLLRVGGRLLLSSLPEGLKHPVILPKNHHLTKLIIRHYHEKTHHQGRGITQNTIRNAGFWIIGATRMISLCISNCCTCCRLRGQVLHQKMADLPADRIEVEAPFSYCGLDLFGPWIIKQGRKELKRYGVLFTCLSSRAVRIEVAPSLETDSFLNALRRFVCRNGPVRQIRCDRGSNFVGASRELQQAYKLMNHDKIKKSLLMDDCDYFPFKFNAPSASYQGGVWERQIRSCRAVLSSLLMKNGPQLDEDSLHTFMVEAENIVNSRPLTVENLINPDGLLPLSPHNILTMKTRLVLPPPGIFGKPDMYLRKRWRRVQHLSNEFWQRWRKEYLQSLQERPKWNLTRRDLKVDDIVIIVDDNSPRNCWKMARVDKVYPNEDGHVRRVLCRVANSALDSKGRRMKDALLLERPIQKLILLKKAEEPGI